MIYAVVILATLLACAIVYIFEQKKINAALAKAHIAVSHELATLKAEIKAGAIYVAGEPKKILSAIEDKFKGKKG